MDNRPLKDRITSRRFLLTLAVSVLVLVAEKFGVTLNQDELLLLLGVVASYNLKDAIAKPTALDQ